jgi:hypothetical protein
MEIPREREAAVLWMKSPTIILNDAEESLVSPNAIPSKKAWVPRASNKTRDCRPCPKLKHSFLAFFLVYSISTLAIIPESDPFSEVESALKNAKFLLLGLNDFEERATKLSFNSLSLVCWLIYF